MNTDERDGWGLSPRNRDYRVSKAGTSCKQKTAPARVPVPHIFTGGEKSGELIPGDCSLITGDGILITGDESLIPGDEWG